MFNAMEVGKGVNEKSGETRSSARTSLPPGQRRLLPTQDCWELCQLFWEAPICSSGARTWQWSRNRAASALVGTRTRPMPTSVLLLNCARPGWHSLMQAQPMVVSGSSGDHTWPASFPIPPFPELQRTTWSLARWCLAPACPHAKRWNVLCCLDRQAFMVGALCTVVSPTHLRKTGWALR